MRSKLWTKRVFTVCALLFTTGWHKAAVAGDGDKVDADLLAAARSAVLAKKYDDVVKIWFLKNTLASVRGARVSTEAPLTSAVWLAMERLKLCPEGLPADPHGLWTIATHNIVLRSMFARESGSAGNPFDAFSSGVQQRNISLEDVLSPEELRSLKFFPGECSLVSYMRFGGINFSEFLLSESAVERVTWAGMLLDSLNLSLKNMRDVRGRSVVESRIFDLQMYLLDKNVTEPGIVEILERAKHWTASDWLALPDARRLYFFSKVEGIQTNRAHSKEVVLKVIDSLVELKSGRELNNWIGIFSKERSTRELREIWDGERGNRLLSLDPESGFRSRSAIALRRGLAALETGDIHNALRYLGLTINFAGREETDSEAIAGLAKRWISYIAGTWKVTADLVSVLKEVLPKDAYTLVFEDLAWRAAFRADVVSFQRAAGLLRQGSAASGRIEQIARLSRGEVAGFAKDIARRLRDEPYNQVRFCNLVLDRLESEDAEIRRRMRPVLEKMSEADRVGTRSASRTNASLEKLSRRADEMLRVLGSQVNQNLVEKSRQYGPEAGIFVGNVRLAPADPLPWPFNDPTVSPPNAFTPIVVRPERWSQEGREIDGWMIVE